MSRRTRAYRIKIYISYDEDSKEDARNILCIQINVIIGEKCYCRKRPE